jgi:hypothetical protein
MLPEKFAAPRPREIGAGLVVARPFLAVKTMLRTRIDVDFDFGALAADDVDIA